jgi:UDPglucose 6-dehydrogenase
MKIGIIGAGIVGAAVHEGLKKLGHNMRVHDIKYDSSIRDVLDTDICFVCVPTPSKENGECDTDIVEMVVDDLNEYNYEGIVAIKSTVAPGTINKFSKTYPNLELCFIPEFLRERCAVADFIDNHDLCVIGTDNFSTYEMLKNVHGYYPKKFVQLSPLEAEFIKYFNNIYNATLVTFANSFYEVCKAAGADYTKIKNTITQRNHINDVYLNCNEDFRGFGGPCLPKDTRTIAAMVKNLKLDVGFFEMLLEENSKYKTTVFEGMREE